MTTPGTQVHVHRTSFTAPEVEAITGVAQVVMRDWRRRGLLKEMKTEMVGRRGAYTAFDVGYLVVLRDLTSKGVAIGAAIAAADVAAPVVQTYAETASVSQRDAFFAGLHGSPVHRFMIVTEADEVLRVGDLSDWTKRCDEEGRSASCIVIDCQWLGEEIARRAPRPVVAVEWRAP